MINQVTKKLASLSKSQFSSILIAKQLVNESEERCDLEKAWCMAHDSFHLDYEMNKLCHCGKKETIVKSDP